MFKRLSDRVQMSFLTILGCVFIAQWALIGLGIWIIKSEKDVKNFTTEQEVTEYK